MFEDLGVVDMTQLHTLPAPHLLHLLPGQDVLRPPAGLGLRVTILWSPSSIAEPDQLGQVGASLCCLQY